jgi:dCMP deaminase
MAKYMSTASKDPSTKTGAVIVRPDKSVCSVGFNGFPSGMEDKKEWYDNREEKYSRIVHCEVNAEIFAREPIKGYTLYTYPFLSCDRCFATLSQAGITRFVAPECPEHLKDRWESYFKVVRERAKSMGIIVDELDFE